MKKTVALLILAAATAAVLNAQTLKAFVMKSEPLGFLDSNGKPTGEHVDYLRAIADRAGVKIEIEVVEKSRMFGALKSGDIDLAIFFRSAKWDADVKYVEKIRDIRVVAIRQAGKPLTRYEELHESQRVGILPDFAADGPFDTDTKIRKFAVPDYETMLKMLTTGRIDTAAGNSIVLSYQIEKAGLNAKIDPRALTLGHGQQWLHFSAKSAHLDLLPKLRQAVLELQKEGVLDTILTRYAGPGWKALNAM